MAMNVWFPGLDGVTATGTGKFVQDGEKNSWGNKDRDAIYLKYTVDFSNGLKLKQKIHWLRIVVAWQEKILRRSM